MGKLLSQITRKSFNFPFGSGTKTRQMQADDTYEYLFVLSGQKGQPISPKPDDYKIIHTRLKIPERSQEA